MIIVIIIVAVVVDVPVVLLCLTGVRNHRDDNADDSDEVDGDTDETDLQSPSVNDEALSVENGATGDGITAAAALLRVLGDRVQHEYGNKLDALMNGLDWTLPRDALLASVRHVLADILSRISDVWTRVSVHFLIWI